MRDKKPISQDKEAIRRSKKNKSTPKKSKHKHDYVLYKEYVGDRNDDTMTMFKTDLGYSLKHSGWKIYHLCSICGKDKGDIYIWASEKLYKEAMENGIDITR